MDVIKQLFPGNYGKQNKSWEMGENRGRGINLPRSRANPLSMPQHLIFQEV